MNKNEILVKFRERADEILELLELGGKDYKGKASTLNKKMVEYKDEYINVIIRQSMNESEKLDNILMITYVTYVVMLEYRNKVWNYEYMAFSRRIGELWEPFCKLPFEYPVNELNLYIPPNIEDVKKTLKDEISALVNSLTIQKCDKEKLLNYYQSIWALIDNSGNISLDLDLHFEQESEFYDVDYKSGFSSNEKGNTNRLLLVASIYKSLPEIHNNLIFVRQKEEENNHYFQTLKHSGLWDVYCAEDTYDKIKEFTGFDIKHWMNINMNWESDISEEFYQYLKENDLLKYLTW